MATLGSTYAAWRLIHEARANPQSSNLKKVIEYRNMEGKLRYGIIFLNQPSNLYNESPYITKPVVIYDRDTEPPPNAGIRNKK